MMPRLRVDKGAIKFVFQGANIMCPGLTSKGATIHDEVELDTPVVRTESAARNPLLRCCHLSETALLTAASDPWQRGGRTALRVERESVLTAVALQAIYAEGKDHALAVGLTKMSTADIKVCAQQRNSSSCERAGV